MGGEFLAVLARGAQCCIDWVVLLRPGVGPCASATTQHAQTALEESLQQHAIANHNVMVLHVKRDTRPDALTSHVSTGLCLYRSCT